MRRVLVSLLVMTVSASASAAVDPSVLDAGKTVKPADYPSANTVIVVNDQAVVYQADGQFTNTVHWAALVLTPAGKADVASASLPYAQDGEKVEVLAAQVIKADGSVVPVPASSIQDTEQSGEMNIY